MRRFDVVMISLKEKKPCEISADWHPDRNTYHKSSNYNCNVFILVATMCGSPKGIRTHSTEAMKSAGHRIAALTSFG